MFHQNEHLLYELWSHKALSFRTLISWSSWPWSKEKQLDFRNMKSIVKRYDKTPWQCYWRSHERAIPHLKKATKKWVWWFQYYYFVAKRISYQLHIHRLNKWNECSCSLKPEEDEHLLLYFRSQDSFHANHEGNKKTLRCTSEIWNIE